MLLCLRFESQKCSSTLCCERLNLPYSLIIVCLDIKTHAALPFSFIQVFFASTRNVWVYYVSSAVWVDKRKVSGQKHDTSGQSWRGCSLWGRRCRCSIIAPLRLFRGRQVWNDDIHRKKFECCFTHVITPEKTSPGKRLLRLYRCQHP